MKFRLSVSKYFYNKKNDAKEIARLESIGFKFSPDTGEFADKDALSVDDFNPSVDIETLEDMMAIVKKQGTVVLSMEEISIYNGYRE